MFSAVLHSMSSCCRSLVSAQFGHVKGFKELSATHSTDERCGSMDQSMDGQKGRW